MELSIFNGQRGVRHSELVQHFKLDRHKVETAARQLRITPLVLSGSPLQRFKEQNPKHVYTSGAHKFYQVSEAIQILRHLKQEVPSSWVVTAVETPPPVVEVVQTVSTPSSEWASEIVRSFEGFPIELLTYKDRLACVGVRLGGFLGYSGEGSGFTDQIRQEWSAEIREGVHYIMLEGSELADFKEISVLAERPDFTLAFSAKGSKLMILFEEGWNLALMKTGKPAGERLRAWLAETVLPSLRRTGRFDVSPPEEEKPPMSQTLASLPFIQASINLATELGYTDKKWALREQSKIAKTFGGWDLAERIADKSPLDLDLPPRPVVARPAKPVLVLPPGKVSEPMEEASYPYTMEGTIKRPIEHSSQLYTLKRVSKKLQQFLGIPPPDTEDLLAFAKSKGIVKTGLWTFYHTDSSADVWDSDGLNHFHFEWSERKKASAKA